jgi:hypothetical protein
VLHKSLGDDLRHNLAGVLDALAALKPERKGEVFGCGSDGWNRRIAAVVNRGAERLDWVRKRTYSGKRSFVLRTRSEHISRPRRCYVETYYTVYVCL